MTQTIPPSTALPLIRHRAEQLMRAIETPGPAMRAEARADAGPALVGVVVDLVNVLEQLAPPSPVARTYRPRHDWGAFRLSTTHEQLVARLVVVDAVGDPNPEHIGRHRSESC